MCNACKVKIEKREYTQTETEVLSAIQDNMMIGVSHPPPIWSVGARLPLPEGLELYPDEALFPKYKGRKGIVNGLTCYQPDFKHILAKEHPQLMLAGFAVAGFNIGYLDTGMQSAMDAVRVRAGLKTMMEFKKGAGPVLIEPVGAAFQKAYQVWQDLRVHWDCLGKVEQMSDEEWVKTQVRQMQLREVLERLKTEPLPPMICKAFVKGEKKLLAKRSPNDPNATCPASTAKPRLIQGYPEEWLAYVGPFVKTVQHRVEEMFSVDKPLHYAGADNPETLNAWLADAVNLKETHWFICIDYAMFDCTHSDYSYDFVEKLYMDLVEPNDRAAGNQTLKELRTSPYGPGMKVGRDFSIADALKKMRWPEGRLKGTLKYKAGKVMNGSGRPDTSLSNILNSLFCLALSITAICYGVQPEEVTSQQVLAVLDVIRVIGSGDDSVCVVPKTFGGRELDQKLWDDLMPIYIAKFGFLAKVEPNPTFDEMVFLGNRAYPVMQGTRKQWFWGPTIGRRIVKHHHLYQCDLDPTAVLHGIVDMEAVCYPHVPLLHDTALAALRILKGQKFNRYQDADAVYKVDFVGQLDQSATARAKPLRSRYKTPPYDEVTLQHVCDVYSVGLKDLKDAIVMLRRQVCMPAVLTHGVLTAVSIKDNGL